MPAPFPGMDPWLEAPAIWPDVHQALATEMRSLLNATLPAPYYARLEMRPEIGIIDEPENGQSRKIVPDVAVAEGARTGGGVAVLAGPRTAISPSIEVVSEPLQHHMVAIRDGAQGHRLVTLIEIVSPSNKRPGPDRESYLQKQRKVLASDANLVEIDLLSGGSRLIADPGLLENLSRRRPRADYIVIVSRAAKRRYGGDRLPGVRLDAAGNAPLHPLPLRPGDAELPLDLQ